MRRFDSSRGHGLSLTNRTARRTVTSVSGLRPSLLGVSVLCLAIGVGGAVAARAEEGVEVYIPFRIGVAYCLYHDEGMLDEVDDQGRNVTSIKCYQRPKGRSMRASISTQLNGTVHTDRYRGKVRLTKPASQYKRVSSFHKDDYTCGRYGNGVTCKIPGHAFFLTSSNVSGH